MSHLLHIDSSVRSTTSITRTLTAEFASIWADAHPGGQVTYRDLAQGSVPHISEEMVPAMWIPPSARTADQRRATELQERLIAELEAVDTLVIGAPMYNFNIPSSLKAWIDHVVVFGRTVDAGLFDGTQVVIVTGRAGAYGPGTPRAPFDFQEPYLRVTLGLVGLTDITFVHAEMRAAAEGDPRFASFVQYADDSLAQARASIKAAAMHSRVASTESSGVSM